jgi:hypothetical protein
MIPRPLFSAPDARVTSSCPRRSNQEEADPGVLFPSEASLRSESLFSALDARASFLLFRQEKGAKEKATPVCRLIRGCAANQLPCAARRAGRLRNSPSRREGSDSPRRIPRPACAARRPTGEGKANRSQPGHEVDLACRCELLARPQAVMGVAVPLRGAEQRRGAGGSRLALSEPKASLASRPAHRVAQGTPRSGAPTQGSPSLWLLSLGETRESTPARQARKPAVNWLSTLTERAVGLRSSSIFRCNPRQHRPQQLPNPSHRSNLHPLPRRMRPAYGRSE